MSSKPQTELLNEIGDYNRYGFHDPETVISSKATRAWTKKSFQNFGR